MYCSRLRIVCLLGAVLPALAGCAERGNTPAVTAVNATQSDAAAESRDANETTEKAGPENVVIPLDQIWAKDMPGTRDIRELGQELVKEQPASTGWALLDYISMALVERAVDLQWKDLTRPGFAVAGTGLPALRAAHAVLVEEAKPREVFSPDEDLTIVFFSEPGLGHQVQIQQVKRQHNSVVIRYGLQPHIEGLEGPRGLNFSLTPLGKLPIGEYHVEFEMRQLPVEQTFVELGFKFKPINEEWNRRFLCKPFSFRVREKRE